MTRIVAMAILALAAAPAAAQAPIPPTTGLWLFETEAATGTFDLAEEADGSIRGTGTIRARAKPGEAPAYRTRHEFQGQRAGLKLRLKSSDETVTAEGRILRDAGEHVLTYEPPDVLRFGSGTVWKRARTPSRP